MGAALGIVDEDTVGTGKLLLDTFVFRVVRVEELGRNNELLLLIGARLDVAEVEER